MARYAKRFTALGAIATALFLASQGVQQSVAVDACLDAGGSFDYVAQACDFESSRPASSGRSPLYLLGALFAVAVGGYLILIE